MKALKAGFQKLGGRFDTYSQRERTMLAAALIGGIILLGNALLIDPNSARARVAQKLGEQQKMEASGLEPLVISTKAQLKVDPDAGRKAEIARLMVELGGIEAKLKALENTLVPPEQMNALLEQLLSRHARLRLVSLKSMPPVNLARSGKPDETEKAPKDALGLYKHGVEIRLEGSYADLYEWLSQLEKTQHKLLWGDVHFTVVEHPRSLLTLTVYTLSTDKAWLAI